MRKEIFIIILVLYAILSIIPMAVSATMRPSVTVHFDSGKAHLNTAEKAKLRALFQTYDVRGAGRVFVLGFTDSRGGQKENLDLSRNRAKSVSRDIISSFGIDATVVLALGKGADNPVADNKLRSGRAKNRRVEVYLANAVARRPQRTYGPDDPYLPRINALVEGADTDVRARQFKQALAKLLQARAIGGDHYSDWHSVMGIAGFYAGAPMAKVKAHLATAVQLDAYNFNARDFLSRLDARHQFASGKVTAQMGRRPDEAIPVTAVVQIYEYLELFDVEPVAHTEKARQSLDIWKCRDSQGSPVIYYFNHAPIYEWVYTQGAASVPPPASQLPSQRKSKVALSGKANKVSAAGAQNGHRELVSEKSPPIWESRLFQ